MAAALAGKYEHVKNENIIEYFKAIGITDEQIEKVGKLAAQLEIVVDGNKVTTKGRTETTFEIGKEFDDVMVTGETLKSVAKMEGNKLVISSTAADGRKGGRSFEITADGQLLITLTAEGCPVVGKRYYKKL